MKSLVLSLTIVLFIAYVHGNFVIYEIHQHVLAHQQASTHLLFNFQAGNAVKFQNSLLTDIGTDPKLKFFLIPLEQNQCKTRKIKFDCPFSYNIRQSGQYLLIIANRGSSEVVSGTVDVTIDSQSTEKLKVLVPRGKQNMDDSLYFLQEFQMPQISTPIHFNIPEPIQGLQIQNVAFSTGTSQYILQYDQNEQKYISDLIPGSAKGFLIIMYSLGQYQLGNKFTYQILIDQDFTCNDGIWNFGLKKCECFEGRVWSQNFKKCSFCGNGIKNIGEQCDSQDGCTSNCQCSGNYVYNAQLNQCSLCGNGIKDNGEECDYSIHSNCEYQCICFQSYEYQEPYGCQFFV